MNEEELINNQGEQPTAIISDEEFEFLVSREFPNQADAVKSKLSKIISDTPKGKNRIATAILKLANKDFNKIDLLVSKANYDFRDIVSKAEYPRASKYDLGERNEDENRKDYLGDWEEFSTWRKRSK